MELQLCFSLVFTLVYYGSCLEERCGFCEDWTLCRRVRCSAPPDPCPEDRPYLLYGECGCCQFCSDSQRNGPCGICQVDLVCKEQHPSCGENQTVSLDYCGCCKTCKTIVGVGKACGSECEPSFTVCEAGLRCVGGTCVDPGE